MDLRALAFLVSVKTGAPAALGRGLDGPTVQNDCAGIGFSFQGQAQDSPQIVGHGFKATGVDPALGLLINHMPRRQIVGHHTPDSAHLDQVAQGVEDFAQGISTLRGPLPSSVSSN